MRARRHYQANGIIARQSVLVRVWILDSFHSCMHGPEPALCIVYKVAGTPQSSVRRPAVGTEAAGPYVRGGYDTLCRVPGASTPYIEVLHGPVAPLFSSDGHDALELEPHWNVERIPSRSVPENLVVVDRFDAKAH